MCTIRLGPEETGLSRPDLPTYAVTLLRISTKVHSWRCSPRPWTLPPFRQWISAAQYQSCWPARILKKSRKPRERLTWLPQPSRNMRSRSLRVRPFSDFRMATIPRKRLACRTHAMSFKNGLCSVLIDVLALLRIAVQKTLFHLTCFCCMVPWHAALAKECASSSQEGDIPIEAECMSLAC